MIESFFALRRLLRVGRLPAPASHHQRGVFALNLVSFVGAADVTGSGRRLARLYDRFSNLELPVTLIIPAFRRKTTVAATVRSLLQLNYSHFEIVVVNDGSSDRTLDVLKEAFGLRHFPRGDDGASLADPAGPRDLPIG